MRALAAAFTSLAAVLLFAKTRCGAQALPGGTCVLALSKGDDYPIHQTPEPVAYAGTDRNFYDRYFFNGYSPLTAIPPSLPSRSASIRI